MSDAGTVRRVNVNVTPFLVLLCVLAAVAAFARMQAQISDLSKAQANLTEMKRVELSNLAAIAESNRRAVARFERSFDSGLVEVRATQALVKSVAEKVGAGPPPEKTP